jgi:hypothetical protein
MAGHRYSERSPQESVSLIEKQDAKLDRFLEDMKAYVLRLPHKLGKVLNKRRKNSLKRLYT